MLLAHSHLGQVAKAQVILQHSSDYCQIDHCHRQSRRIFLLHLVPDCFQFVRTSPGPRR